MKRILLLLTAVLAAGIMTFPIISAAITTGDGYLLKRSQGEICHSCHRTNVNTPSTDANWGNAIKMHSAETLGTCSNTTYKTRSECIDPLKGNGTWDPGKWGGSGDPGWGTSAVGSKYGEFLCTTCHTAHDTKNIYLIKEVITTPDDSNFQGRVSNSVSVDFQTTGSSGGGLMGDDTHDAPTSSRICEVCHTYDATQTSGVNKHAYDMSAGAVSHQGIGGCTTCHSHKGAFTGGGCTGCHGYPPVADTAASPDGLAWTNPTGSTVAGAHNLHYTTKSYPCTACHYNSSGSGATHGSSGDGSITMGFYMFDGAYQGGNYDGQTGTDGYNVPSPNTTPVTTVTELGNKTCSLYCHGSTLDAIALPVWSGTISCGSCHTALQTDVSRGSHARHARSAPNRELACTVCHANYVATPTAHTINGKADWDFDDTKSWLSGALYNGLASGSKTPVPSASYNTCSNLYCHSDVQTDSGGATTYLPTPQWGGTVGCSSIYCHGGDTDPNKVTTGSHTKHVQTSTYNYSCSTCHTNSGINTTKHADHNIDVLMDAAYGGSYSQVPNPPANGYGNCSTVYCHGKYNGSGLNATPTWGNTSSAACGTCHGASNTTTPASGAHKRHASSGLTGGRTDREYACTLCHKDIVGGSGPSSYTISDKIKHVSGKVDWKFDIADSRVSGTSTYSIASGTAVPSDGTTPRAYGTCSNVYCHSNVQPPGGVGAPSSYDTPNWKTTINCSSRCHAPADITYFHGTTIATGSHSQHMAYTFNSYKINRCTLCHKWNSAAAGVFDGTTCTNQCHFSSDEKTLHADGSINVMFDTYFGSGVYNGASAPGNDYSNCSNTYCHSDGTSVSTSSIPNNTSANWGSGALACSACHGNPPNYTSGLPKTNSHAKHSGYLCNKCHVNTTSNGTTITNKTNHVNKAYNVNAGAGASFTYSFLVTGGTCSSISCHSNGNATWGGTVACGNCHALPPATGKHLAHTDGTGAAYGNDSNNSSTTAYRFNCGNCHPFDGAKHGDGTVDVELYNASATGFKQYNPSSATRTGTGVSTVCKNVYCHSNGMATPAYADTPSWGGTFAGNKCAGCHGDPPNTGGKTGSAGHYAANWMGAGKEGGHLVGIHFDNVYTGTTGLIAKGGGAGSGAAHGDPGTSTTISCNLCHTATANWTASNQFSTKSGAGTAFDCATCHTGANPIQNTAGAITDKSKHVNHDRDVQFASFTLKSKSQNRTTPAGWTRNSYKADGTSYDNITFSITYVASEKSCMTSCHLGHAIKWDDTNVTTCYSCHKDL